MSGDYLVWRTTVFRKNDSFYHSVSSLTNIESININNNILNAKNNFIYTNYLSVVGVLMQMISNKLGQTALNVTALGFGCASMGNLFRTVTDKDARNTLDAAWDCGMRYFDTAPYYGLGLSERRLGDALRDRPRKDYVISTKVGRLLKPDHSVSDDSLRYGFASSMPFRPEYDYSYDGVMRSFEASLQRLGLSKIDILLVHDIGKVTHGTESKRHMEDLEHGGYKALAELRASGDISAVGLGVNEWEVCEEVMKFGRFDSFLLAGRYTLLEQLALDSFLPKCLDHGASIILGGAYNSGILATGVGGDFVGNYNYEPAPANVIEKVKRIEVIADAHNVTLAAAALQFPGAHDAIVSVIPGLGKVSRVKKTLDLFQEVIPAAFWDDMRSAGLSAKAVPTPSARS